jgi:hypothetical protein
MARLTWKQAPLQRFEFIPSVFHLNFGDLKELASVSGIRAGGHHGDICAWMWSCGSNADLGIEWHNTAASKELVATPEEAKAQAEAYIRSCLEAKGFLKPRKELKEV